MKVFNYHYDSSDGAYETLKCRKVTDKKCLYIARATLGCHFCSHNSYNNIIMLSANSRIME